MSSPSGVWITRGVLGGKIWVCVQCIRLGKSNRGAFFMKPRMRFWQESFITAAGEASPALKDDKDYDPLRIAIGAQNAAVLIDYSVGKEMLRNCNASGAKGRAFPTVIVHYL